MACSAAFTFGHLHFNMAGPAELLVEIIAETFGFFDLDLQGAALVRRMTFGACQFFLVFVMREDYCLLTTLNMKLLLKVYSCRAC